MDRIVENEVTIHFSGACTHFRGVVPGVPHRVVLADATPIRFELITLPDQSEAHPYVIMPHIPQISISSPEGDLPPLNVPGVIKDGVLYSGACLSIPNAADTVIEYEDEWVRETPRLTNFVPRYEYSTGVVLGGRASCYFDLCGGSVYPEQNGSALNTMVTIKTIGAPILRITPFAVDFVQSGGPLPVNPITSNLTLAPMSDIYLANEGLGCSRDESGFDFMLHYLTAASGIPQQVTQLPHGASWTPQTPSILATAAIAGGTAALLDSASIKTQVENLFAVYSGSSSAKPLRVSDVGTNASCSDAQYP